MQPDYRPIKFRIIKILIVIQMIYLACHTPVALAQDVSATIRPSQVTQAWESARDGALIGFGSGAAISLLSYSFNAKNTDYTRILAGTTGAGFLFGALYGLFEDRFFSDSTADRTSSIRPQVFAGREIGYGLHASYNF